MTTGSVEPAVHGHRGGLVGCAGLRPGAVVSDRRKRK
jgi:hypothetical protein